MPRATSKTTTPAPAPVVTKDVKSAAKAESKAAAEPKAKKAKAPKEEKPVAEAAPAAAPAAGEEVVADATGIAAKLADYNSKIQQLVSVVSVLKNEYKLLEKSVSRELKNAQKASSKKKRSSGNRAPSGFVKPALISDELAVFLGKEKGSEIARTVVSKEIHAYIRANNLKDKDNGRIIHPDAKLTKLLKIGKDEELTYFNLQKYMKGHFTKAVPAATTA